MSKDPRHRVPGAPGSSFTRALAVACLAVAAASSAAIAAWSPSGYPFSTANGEQSSLRAVTDGRGGFIAAWIDTNGGTPRIFSQRVDSTGATQWTAGGVLVNSTFTGLADLTAAPDGANGLLLAWTADRAVARKNVYVQRLNASGAAQWGANGLLVDPTSVDTLQGSPSIAADGSGGAIVAWVENRGNTDDDVFVQHIASDSARAWLAGGVGVDSTNGDDQANPRVLGDGTGGAWVSWEDVAGPTRTFFQRYNSSGAAQWTAGGVTPTSNATQSLYAHMARISGSDSLLIAWTQVGPAQIRGAKVTPAGVFLAASDVLETSSLLPVGLVALPGGASLLVFASGSQIRSVAVTSAGSVGSATTLASSQTLDATSNITVVADGTAGLYVVWSSAGTAYARHVTSAGSSDWAGPVALTSGVTPAQSRPVAVGGFDLLAAWVDDRNAGTTGLDLFSQRVSPSGVTGQYFRINATLAGTGLFTAGGGRTWVRQGDSLRVSWAGNGGNNRVSQAVVGGTTFGPVPNYTFHNVAGDSTLAATVSNTAVTTQLAAVAGSYRAFSAPFTLTSPAVSAAFANLMPYDIARWRLGHWEADDSTYLEPSGALASIVPGAGYWFIGLKDTTLSFSGTPVAEAQFNLSMLGGPVSGRGWTQFGSPFRFPVAVSQLRLSNLPSAPITDAGNTFTDPQVLEWNPGSSTYGAVSTLLPGRAYWLWRQSAAAVTLRFMFEWNPVATVGLAPSLATLGDWAVGVTARSGEREAHLVFGAAPVAPGQWNRLSTHALPGGPGEALSLVARVSDWGEDNGDYASVFRPDAGSLAWEFDASATSGLTESALSFAFTNLPAGRRVVLSEPATGWSREVEADASVPLVLSANPRRLRLEVLAGGPVTPSTPLVTALRAAGPNPFRESATLSFSLARSGPLRWDVYDLAGRRVVSGTRTLDAGEHALTWDGRDDAGRRVEPGLYLLRWQADGRSGTARLVRTD